MSPLKPIKTEIFNFQFLLIGFHSVGKVSIYIYIYIYCFFFVKFFNQMLPFFRFGLYNKCALFLFSPFASYRANWINNAAIIVWVCCY